MKSEPDILLDSRRAAYKEIDRIVKSDANDKLSRCMNIASIHYCLTGEDSLVHPVVREAHAKLIEKLPDMITRAKAVKKQVESGQVSLI